MTVKELSQLYWLTKEIDFDTQRLEELEERAVSITSPQITGMPKGPRNTDSIVARLAAEVLDLKAIIAAKQIQCIHERARLERYINSIPDSLTRMIFRLRFIDGQTWEGVADAIGGVTGDSARMACYRYLRRTEETEADPPA